MRGLFATLGKTVVLVTHDVAEAAWLADTLVLLRAGRIVQQGSARELAEPPADPFVAQFMTAQRSLDDALRSEEHTSELQALMRISYAVVCITTKHTQVKTTYVTLQ